MLNFFWHISNITWSEENLKSISVTLHTPRVLLTSAFFLQKLSIFTLWGNTDKNYIFSTFFLTSLTFIEFLKNCLRKIVAVLMIPAKLKNLALLKIKIFSNRGCVIISFVSDTTNKFITCLIWYCRCGHLIKVNYL